MEKWKLMLQATQGLLTESALALKETNEKKKSLKMVNIVCADVLLFKNFVCEGVLGISQPEGQH